MQKDGSEYFSALEIKNVTVEDAGKYKVTAKNELGESNATITLNFDSKFLTSSSISIYPLLLLDLDTKITNFEQIPFLHEKKRQPRMHR